MLIFGTRRFLSLKLGTDLCCTEAASVRCAVPFWACVQVAYCSAICLSAMWGLIHRRWSIKARQCSVRAQCGHVFVPICSVNS